MSSVKFNRVGQFVKVNQRIVANQAEVKGIFLICDLRPREDVKAFVDDGASVISLESTFKVGEVFAAEQVSFAAREKQDISLDDLSMENSRR